MTDDEPPAEINTGLPATGLPQPQIGALGGRAAARRARFRRMSRLPLLSPRQWLRRLVFWFGAILVALLAILFARAADEASRLFHQAVDGRSLLVLLLAPAGITLAVLLTRTVFPGAQGSGIPQTIAALHMHETAAMDQVLSLKVAVGKVALTLLGLLSGASIGREGPTVQVSAAVMHGLGRMLRLPRLDLQRGLVLAGGAAGVSAAFNTPIAGIVFAIEELAHSFEARTSGVVLGAVILAGITTLALAGNYSYFGVISVELNIGMGWIAVALCAAAGGVAGGAFSQVLVSAARGVPGAAGRWLVRHPLLFAAGCGLALALLGLLSGGTTYGTGYAEASSMLQGQSHLPALYPVYKLLATLVSYLSGIPAASSRRHSRWGPRWATGSRCCCHRRRRGRWCCWAWWDISPASPRRRSPRRSS